MRAAALGFLAGTGMLQQLASLPDRRWSLLLPVVLLFLWRMPGRWFTLVRVTGFAMLGFLWAIAMGHVMSAGGLDPALEGRDVLVEGTIVSLPDPLGQRSRFQFQAERLWLDEESFSSTDPSTDRSVAYSIKSPPGKLLLSWYRDAPPLQVGERWRLRLRLKQPNGFMNPGGFDYEGWLFGQGVRAKGYVRKAQADDENRRLQAASGHLVDRLRQTLRDGIRSSLAGHPQTGLVTALAVGDRSAIEDAQWDMLIRTGTNHLLAISGLHVGLVSGMIFFLMRWLWSRSACASLYWPAPKAGAVAALLAATLYAALAGFAVPTQRALVMVAVVMLALILQRQTRPSSLLALALLAVLMIDPLAVLAPGFWLSFAAVAAILLGMSGRVGGTRGWRSWGRVQWVVTLGLLPLLILLFQRASLVAPLANLLAVPWVSLLTVPLTLLGSLLWLLFPTLGGWLLAAAAWSLSILWWVLEWLGAWSLAQWTQSAPPVWAVASALLGVMWLILPRGFPARWLGWIWLLPLLVVRPSMPLPGEAEFTLLDVGQGLAAVVHTHNHVLVFDTGPRFPSGFNTGEAVIAPFLRQRGLTGLDLLIVSHGDNDHMGGALALAAELPPRQVLSSVPQRLAALGAWSCLGGMRWEWDGVDFELLHPRADYTAGGRRGNNRSCVLRVTTAAGSVLIPGDIEQSAERYLLTDQPDKLAADVLVVPHHGSRTSSSEAFIDAVAPQFALFPVGYRNRYGHPKADIVERYRQRGIRLLDSASHGAIRFRLGEPGGLRLLDTWRQSARRYWHRLPDESDG